MITGTPLPCIVFESCCVALFHFHMSLPLPPLHRCGSTLRACHGILRCFHWRPLRHVHEVECCSSPAEADRRPREEKDRQGRAEDGGGQRHGQLDTGGLRDMEFTTMDSPTSNINTTKRGGLLYFGGAHPSVNFMHVVTKAAPAIVYLVCTFTTIYTYLA